MGNAVSAAHHRRNICVYTHTQSVYKAVQYDVSQNKLLHTATPYNALQHTMQHTITTHCTSE